jgi:hypothetical protein
MLTLCRVRPAVWLAYTHSRHTVNCWSHAGDYRASIVESRAPTLSHRLMSIYCRDVCGSLQMGNSGRRLDRAAALKNTERSTTVRCRPLAVCVFAAAIVIIATVECLSADRDPNRWTDSVHRSCSLTLVDNSTAKTTICIVEFCSTSRRCPGVPIGTPSWKDTRVGSTKGQLTRGGIRACSAWQ